MNQFKDVSLRGPLGMAARVFRCLPFKASLAVGRFLGRVGYLLMSKKRALVYANLKTAFSQDKSPAKLRELSREVFINLTQSFVELLCIGNMKRQGFEHFVKIRGQEHVDEAMRQDKGVIFLAVHSGNWELGNAFNSLTGYVYNIVANQQPKMPELEVLLNESRVMAGAKMIEPKVATKEIIKALQRKEIVGLILDQGGAEGVSVNFFGKRVSMSSGAIRLALKYEVPLCVAWITRQRDGTHILEFFPFTTLMRSGNLEQDIQVNVQQKVSQYEALLEKHPQEYLWFYKVFKYTTDAQVLILDDGQTSHVEQSKCSVQALTKGLNEQGKMVKEKIVKVDFKSIFIKRIFPLYLFAARWVKYFRHEDWLKYFLSEESYSTLMKVKADFVVSCGRDTEGVNFILSKNHQAKAMVLKAS